MANTAQVTLGYRESLTLSQIKTFLDMESHEERVRPPLSPSSPTPH